MRPGDVIITNTNKENVYKGASGGKELRQGMVELCMHHGQSFQQSEAICNEVIYQVSRFECGRQYMNMDTQLLLQQVFDQMKDLDGPTRMEKKQQIWFGLGIIQEEHQLAALEEGLSYQDLFFHHCSPLTYTPQQEKELEQKIFGRLEMFRASGRNMKRLISASAGEGDCVAAAAALGIQSHELKCLTALELYMTNPELSIEDAALAACTHIHMQSLTDAVDGGLFARDVTDQVLKGLALAVVVAAYCGVIWVMIEKNKFLLPVIGFAAVCAALKTVVDKGPDLIGTWAVNLPERIKEKVSSVKANFDCNTKRLERYLDDDEDDWIEDDVDCYNYLI